MKGDRDLKVPCQNPRCYFYLQVPGCDTHSSLRNSPSPGPAFKKEVGYDRSTGRMTKTRPSQSSDFLFSQGDRSNKNSIWAFEPENKGYMGKPTQQSNKVRSQSISVGSNAATVKGLSACHRLMQSAAELEKAKLMRKRLMSVPLATAGMESLIDSGESDLVEDAFLSSPLPEFALVEKPTPGAVGEKMVNRYYIKLPMGTLMLTCTCMFCKACSCEGWSLY